MSLWASGTPSSGPISPAARRVSAPRAIARVLSRSTATKAFKVGFSFLDAVEEQRRQFDGRDLLRRERCGEFLQR